MIAVKPDGRSSDCWATPWELVRELEREFGVFDLDPCCTSETAKAMNYYTPKDDGLAKPWLGRVFLNPPYSNLGPWLKKATEKGPDIVVALLPVRTDTGWFHRYVLGIAELRFIKGRIKWLGWQGTPIPNPKDPSMLAIYR